MMYMFMCCSGILNVKKEKYSSSPITVSREIKINSCINRCLHLHILKTLYHVSIWFQRTTSTHIPVMCHSIFHPLFVSTEMISMFHIIIHHALISIAKLHLPASHSAIYPRVDNVLNLRTWTFYQTITFDPKTYYAWQDEDHTVFTLYYATAIHISTHIGYVHYCLVR